jgi:hypothetical protein
VNRKSDLHTMGEQGMNRQQRRAGRRRKLEVGTVIRTQTITAVATGELYWFECPENFSLEGGLPPGVTLHGPFKTKAEVNEHQQLTLLGPQCKVIEGGAWDPNWDKLQ